MSPDQYKKHRAHTLRTALERLGSEGWLDKLGPAGESLRAWRQGLIDDLGGEDKVPDEFKQLLASLTSREETIRAIERILSNPDHPHFMRALQFAADRGYGPPRQSVDVEMEPPVLVMSPISALKGTGEYE